MRYFVPGIEKNDAENEYRQTISYLIENGFNIAENTIYSLIYNHNEIDYRATVGDELPMNGEIVMAIFRTTSDTYLVCTRSRGWNRSGVPIITGNKGQDLIKEVIFFE